LVGYYILSVTYNKEEASSFIKVHKLFPSYSYSCWFSV
jgi:hypothetical protein